ncbi:hypothetical protein [Nibricoccus sp. IMCC34717]|uniref:hypothetical protein n=1 Tax=Nibricoccus sp. IMCC34717 TaxID=3034021 RepID=UPI00384BC515
MKMPASMLLKTLLAACVLALPSYGKNEKWKMPDGKVISAEASDIIGPFAILGGAGVPGRKLPLSSLAEGDAVRFAEAMAKKTWPTNDWSKSKSTMATDLAAVTRVDGDKLVPVDRKGVPEPLLYLVFFADSSVGDSWGFVGSGGWKYSDLKGRFPGGVEFVMAGVRHNRGEQKKMMVDMKVPFLSLDPYEVSSSYAISRAAGEPPLALLMTREGTIIGGARDKDSLEAVFKDIELLLALAQPNDPRSWKDRLGFYRTVQPKLFAKGSADPLLIGDPLNAPKLRELGVFFFQASLRVSAAGEVTSVMLKPGAKMPADLGEQISRVLRQTVFVAAVKDGQFVEGSYEYQFGTP